MPTTYPIFSLLPKIFLELKLTSVYFLVLVTVYRKHGKINVIRNCVTEVMKLFKMGNGIIGRVKEKEKILYL